MDQIKVANYMLLLSYNVRQRRQSKKGRKKLGILC